MKVLSRLGQVGLAGVLALVMLIPAHSAEVTVEGRVSSDVDLLDGFDIVIGDLGDRFDGWGDRETRVAAEVYDGNRFHEHYFDNLPAMMFVLRELYGRARITYLEVPEYAGSRHLAHGHEGHGLIDGRYAWYLWDYGHYSRGGTPLVLAFYDYDDALREARYRDADVLSYEEMMWRLNDWADRSYDRVYWRGWDHDRWREPQRWSQAWDYRWPDSRWDSRDGWVGVQLRLGDFNVRWESDGDVFRRDRYYDDRYYRNRVVSDFVFDVGHDGLQLRGVSDIDGGGDADRGHGNDPDGYDEDNPGKSKGHGSKSKPPKGPKNNPGKGKGKNK